jgi:hypothetical protein
MVSYHAEAPKVQLPNGRPGAILFHRVVNRVAVGIVVRAISCALTAVVGVLSGACVDVNGGAVELSWSIRTDTGMETNCENAGITQVALCVRQCDMSACTGPTICPAATWECDRLRGATLFDIAPGRTELTIRADCRAGTANVVLPPPLVRDIVFGDVTQLNALLITVPSSGRACP